MKNESSMAPTMEDETTTADPFSEIKGIGPKTKDRLYEEGIRTVDKLAALSLPELAALVDDIPGMSAERIEREDWLGQARRQVAQTTSLQEDEATGNDNRQHYASFTLQLVLNEDYSVRLTRVFNNKNKTEEKWEGWDEKKMVTVIADMAGVRLSSTKTGPPEKPEDQPVPSTESPSAPKGKVQLRQLDALLADTDSPHHLVPHDQPFRLCLTLDLIDIDVPDDSRLDYTATIYAKKLGTGERQLVTKQQNTVPLQSSLSIPIEGVSMPPGTFRLQAMVNLNLPQAERDFATSLEGSILQVY